MTATFQCAGCTSIKPINIEGGTGYAVIRYEKKICYDCCAIRDRADMKASGKAVLYLTMPGRDFDMGVREGKDIRAGKVTNWPDTLSFTLNSGTVRKGRHNIAGCRYDFWFIGPDGKLWHGVQYGDNTQIARCNRVKS